MMLPPGGAVLVGAIAAVLSVCGFRFADADAEEGHNMKMTHYEDYSGDIVDSQDVCDDAEAGEAKAFFWKVNLKYQMCEVHDTNSDQI